MATMTTWHPLPAFETLTFDKLHPGTEFRCNSRLYMKMQTHNPREPNAVCLEGALRASTVRLAASRLVVPVQDAGGAPWSSRQSPTYGDLWQEKTAREARDGPGIRWFAVCRDDTGCLHFAASMDRHRSPAEVLGWFRVAERS